MKTSVLLATVLGLVASVCASAQTLTLRTDSSNGSFSHTVDYTAKSGLEAYALDYDAKYPEYGVGGVVPVASSKDSFVLAGGYLASWPSGHSVGQLFAEPWVIAGKSCGNLKLHAAFAYYLPLNGGKEYLLSNDCSALYALTPKVKVGVAATLWGQTGSPAVVRYGPKVSLTLPEGFSLTAAAYLSRDNGNNYRVNLTHAL